MRTVTRQMCTSRQGQLPPADMPKMRGSLAIPRLRAGCESAHLLPSPAPLLENACMTPNRVNRAHWPTKENSKTNNIFLICSVHGKIASDGPKWGQEDLFPTNPDLADILGRTDLNFEIFFLIFWTPNFRISRSPDLQISGFPGPQISKFPDLQIPRSPNSQISRRRRRRRRTNSQIPT